MHTTRVLCPAALNACGKLAQHIATSVHARLSLAQHPDAALQGASPHRMSHPLEAACALRAARALKSTSSMPCDMPCSAASCICAFSDTASFTSYLRRAVRMMSGAPPLGPCAGRFANSTARRCVSQSVCLHTKHSRRPGVPNPLCTASRSTPHGGAGSALDPRAHPPVREYPADHHVALHRRGQLVGSPARRSPRPLAHMVTGRRHKGILDGCSCTTVSTRLEIRFQNDSPDKGRQRRNHSPLHWQPLRHDKQMQAGHGVKASIPRRLGLPQQRAATRAWRAGGVPSRSRSPGAHRAADEVCAELVGAHRHFYRLVVLCGHVHVAHKDAARGRAARASGGVPQQPIAQCFRSRRTCGTAGSSGSAAL